MAPVSSAAPPKSSAAALAPAPCRVLQVTGRARAGDGAELVALGGLDGKSWLELEANTKLSVRHGATAREFALVGPGRFLACRSGLEQVLIAEGGFESSPGAGVRPGAEMWVATPFAALRYADGSAAIRADRGATHVRVSSGRITVESTGENSRSLTLSAPSEKHWPSAVAPAARLKTCETAAGAAKTSADAVLSAANTELGKLAAAQLASRRRARAECLIAEAAIERVRDPGEKARLRDQLERANRAWQGVPAMLR